jgi:hypothetical protein
VTISGRHNLLRVDYEGRRALTLRGAALAGMWLRPPRGAEGRFEPMQACAGSLGPAMFLPGHAVHAAEHVASGRRTASAASRPGGRGRYVLGDTARSRYDCRRRKTP